jgi:hypothetical protein
MTLLAILLLIDAALHAVVIFHYGTADNNMPFLVFAIIDLALAIIVFLAVPYAVWAVLILSVIGIIGLTVTFGKPQRDKTLDRIIWAVDLAIVVLAVYLLFFQQVPAVAA